MNIPVCQSGRTRNGGAGAAGRFELNAKRRMTRESPRRRPAPIRGRLLTPPPPAAVETVSRGSCNPVTQVCHVYSPGQSTEKHRALGFENGLVIVSLRNAKVHVGLKGSRRAVKGEQKREAVFPHLKSAKMDSWLLSR